MSALAKKMMEKYGWKEGEGLGKERTGMKSYVKVVRRDPHTATGLGHAADPAQGGSLASTHAVELDAIYGQLHTTTRKRQAKQTSDGDHPYDKDAESSADETSSSSRSSSIRSRNKASAAPPEPARTRATATKRSRHHPSSSSSASSSSGSRSSDSDEDREDEATRTKREPVGDVTRMSDKDLFQRCGGVRLGRAGRHRFFDGKLKRIHDSS